MFFSKIDYITQSTQKQTPQVGGGVAHSIPSVNRPAGHSLALKLRKACFRLLIVEPVTPKADDVSNQMGATKPILKRTTRVRLNIGWGVRAKRELLLCCFCDIISTNMERENEKNNNCSCQLFYM